MRAVAPGPTAGARPIAPTLGGPKQRLVLALLLCEPNSVVPVDRLVDGVWDLDPPGTARHTVQAYVSELRKEIGAQVERTGSGYTVAVDRDTLDSLDFEARVSSGRSISQSDPSAAIEELDAAIALWRGDAFEEFPDHPTLQIERARLDELRVVAAEDLIRARLATGQHADVIVDLVRLTQEHPYREELRALHMLALYRTGRQADALREYQRTRRILDDDLGIVPSPRLRRLEEQILLQDPDLEPAVRSTVGSHRGTHVENPYQGLRAFQEQDEDRFFGRDELIDRLVDRVRDDCRFTAVVGPSGSGKSSVVQAGAIPRLRREAPAIRVVTMQPGTKPFAELHASLDRSGGERARWRDGDDLCDAVARSLPPGATRLLIVIDQFEELFTMVDADVAERFMDMLVQSIGNLDGRVRILITLRADFYDRPLANARFGALFADNVVNVVALAPDQLEVAATEPARRLDVQLEPRLVGRLIADVAGQPNALPLFQFALTELFDERTSGMLEMSTYERIGGVRRAVARRAESLYERLGTDEREAAHHLFLRIATISDGIVGRRRVPASELVSLDVDVVALQAAIDLFVRYRLLVLDRDPASGVPTIEVAHEALLAEWTRLRDWIEESHSDLLTQMSFTTALREWEGARRSPGYLLTGARLDDYEQWATTTKLRLTTLEREYLDESIDARTRDEVEAEARRTTEVRRRRRSRGQVLLLFTVAAALSAVIAYPLVISSNRDSVAMILTDRRTDSRFDELLARGLEQAADDNGFDAVVLEPPYATAEYAARRELATGPALMFGGFLMVDVLVDLAPEFLDTTFVLVDVGVDPQPGPNLVTVNFAVEEGSFLVGAAAALESRSGKVGYIGANSSPHIDVFRAGFEQGAATVDADVEVVSRLIRPAVDGEPRYDGYENAAMAKQIATEMYRDDGVDVIFVAAGDSGRGVAEAADELSTPARKLWMIGVDNDQLFDLPESQREHVLTSMVKRFDAGVAAAVAAHADESLAPGQLSLGLADDAVGYTTSGGFLDNETVSALEGFRSEIIDGRRRVAPTPVAAVPVPEVVTEADATLVTFDGTDCVVEGPQSYGLGADQQFVFTNRSTGVAAVTVWKVPDGTELSDATNGGIFELTDVSSGLRAVGESNPGDAVAVSAMIDEPGDWLVMCVDDFDHPGAVATAA